MKTTGGKGAHRRFAANRDNNTITFHDAIFLKVNRKQAKTTSLADKI